VSRTVVQPEVLVIGAGVLGLTVAVRALEAHVELGG